MAPQTTLFWTGTSFLLPYAIFQLFIRSLSDIFGRRKALLGAVICFTAGAVTLLSLTELCPVYNRPHDTRALAVADSQRFPILSFEISWPIASTPENTIHSYRWHGLWEQSPDRYSEAYSQTMLLGVGVFYINFPFCGLGDYHGPICPRLFY